MDLRILPTLTTTSSSWRDKIEEIKNLELREISIFPTCLAAEEREELYDLLKRTGVKKIPFVHLRSDMMPEELSFLISDFGAEIFNIHTEKEYPYPPDIKICRDKVYIENTMSPFDEKEIHKFAGICLDLAHLENARIFRPEIYRHNIGIIEKYACGCNHLAPSKNFSFFDKNSAREKNHPHFLNNLAEMDYLKRYPRKYFSQFIALEVENSIKEQLKIIDYIKSL